MKTREEAVLEMVNWHQVVDPGLLEVYQFPATMGGDANEPINLLEVSSGTFWTGRIDTFTFRGTEDIPYPLRIATITAEEMRQVREGLILLPPGWDLASATRLELPPVTHRWRKSLPRRDGNVTGQRGLPAKRLPTPSAKRAA